MTHKFDKKIFTGRLYFGDLLFLISHSPRIIRAFGNRKISRAMVEKIMTVTTAVNGCVYCTWFHARQAVSSGISEEEVKNMLNLQFNADASDFEVPALLYAQHYAETDRNPDPEMTLRLTEFYGERTAKDVFLFIRVIYFGNLTGNTWDAVLSRFRGNPAENSSLLFEFVFFLLNFIFMFPAMLLMRLDEGRKRRRQA